ncbi:hypothetical protein EON81_09425 [bacterium]|nr:MAG: hypothetical protein EON81_09425 [bacterium]
MSRLASLFIAGALSLTAVASADLKDWIFDFTDFHYSTNGVNPAKLEGRRQAPSAAAVLDTPFFRTQRNVRVISTFAGYGSSGELRFFTVNAGFGPDGFTADAAGRKAREIADTFIEYVFPNRGTDPIGLGSRRQDMVLITNHGYFSKNPLGLWLHAWVNYTPAAFNTEKGRKELEKLTKENGLAADGTPIIKKESDIRNLQSKGFVTVTTRNDGLRYAICPMYKDPRGGAIAPDAFLNYVKRIDGSPLDPNFTNAFASLQTSGDWPRKP